MKLMFMVTSYEGNLSDTPKHPLSEKNVSRGKEGKILNWM